jgi:hypothetical protein
MCTEALKAIGKRKTMKEDERRRNGRVAIEVDDVDM